MSFQVSIIKKNQVIAWLITLVLGVAGILNYVSDPKKNYKVEVTGKMEDDLGEAVLVDSKNLVSNVDEYMAKLETEGKQNTASAYFAKSRMERNNSFAERLETYEKMMTNESLSKEQKEFAQAQIEAINNQKNAISVAENLMKLKGIQEAVILQNGESINVVVAEENLTEAQIAQIQHIIQNEIGGNVENIHINNL